MFSTTKNKSLGLFLLFLLCPILALPFIINGIRIGDKKCYFLFTIFMGLIAYMLAPIADLGGHYIYSDFLSRMDWEVFKIYLSSKKDYITQIIEWGIPQIGLPFEILPLLEVVISFSLIHSMFCYSIKNSSKLYTKKEIFIRYVLYLLLFPFIILVSGIRFGIAVVIMLYAFHLWLERKKMIWPILLICISCFIHFSITYFVIPIVILLYIPLNKYRMIFLLVIALASKAMINESTANYLIENEMAGSAYLGDGVWGNTENKDFANTAIIYHWGQRVLLLPLLFILFSHFKQMKRWGNILLGFILLFIVFMNFFTITQRITVCILIFSIFFLLKIEDNGYTLSHKSRRILVICAIISCCFDIWTHRKFINLSNYQRLLQPAPITLIQTYSKDWVLKNNT